jgi:hypothetical protein
VGAAVSFGRRGRSKAKSAAKQNPRNAQIPEKFFGIALQKSRSQRLDVTATGGVTRPNPEKSGAFSLQKERK